MKRPLIFLLTLVLFSLAFAQETPAPAQTTQPTTATEEKSIPLTGKVTIAADHMEAVLKNYTKLDGNVEITFIPSGETLAKLKKQIQSDEIRVILNADHMTLFFAEENGETSSRPDKIQANGRVRIHTPDGRSATGDQAEWDMANGGTITLQGKCTVMADGRVMNSTRITYDLKENRLNAERAIITLPVQSSGKQETGLPVLDTLPKPVEENK